MKTTPNKHYWLLLSLCLALLDVRENFAQIVDTKSGLALDHIFIVVRDSPVYADTIQAAGLTLAEQWKTPHKGQGTTGQFAFFLNTYLELLAVTDSAQVNKKMGHEFSKRSNREPIAASPFGFGFRQIPMDTARFPFPTRPYQAAWTGGETLYMALSNDNLQEPIVFVEPPDFANTEYSSLQALDTVVRFNPNAKRYRTHRLGIERLTSIVLTVTTPQEKWSPTLQTLNRITNIRIVVGSVPHLELVFDNARQKITRNFLLPLALTLRY
jgi:hypothetical protein